MVGFTFFLFAINILLKLTFKPKGLFLTRRTIAHLSNNGFKWDPNVPFLLLALCHSPFLGLNRTFTAPPPINSLSQGSWFRFQLQGRPGCWRAILPSVPVTGHETQFEPMRNRLEKVLHWGHLGCTVGWAPAFSSGPALGVLPSSPEALCSARILLLSLSLTLINKIFK